MVSFTEGLVERVDKTEVDSDGVEVGFVLGLNDGFSDDVDNGLPVGDNVGLAVGFDDGPALGVDVGANVGANDGNNVGTTVGDIVGCSDGSAVGDSVGSTDCSNVGKDVVPLLPSCCLTVGDAVVELVLGILDELSLGNRDGIYDGADSSAAFADSNSAISNKDKAFCFFLGLVFLVCLPLPFSSLFSFKSL